MGLDITAYRNLTEIPCALDRDGYPIDEPDNAVQLRADTSFKERADSIKDNAVYRYEKKMGFKAGSYSGYNQWREELSRFAGYAAEPSTSTLRSGAIRHDAGAWRAESGPFWELINMSDCEGVIGPVTSAKLAKDFADYQDRADSFSDDYWRDKYAAWREAFEMASQNGAVDFH